MILLTGAPRNGLTLLSHYFKACGFVSTRAVENAHDYVDLAVVSINNDILRSAGCAWNYVPNGTTLNSDGSINYRISQLINQNPNIDYLTDPRFTFTWPIWEKVIGDVDLFVTFRCPGEAALSFRTEFGGYVSEAIAIWQQYYVRLATVKGAFVEFGAGVDFCDYDDNMARAMSFLELEHKTARLEKVYCQELFNQLEQTGVSPVIIKLYHLLQTKKEN